jgi:hypothetical protein
MRLAGAVLSSVDDPKTFHDGYDDDETALNWLLDIYARAAVATKQWNEATRALELAAQGLENGHLNVSNVINLGALYADLGQGDKALRVLAEISDADSSTLLSPFGRMQWQGVRLAAALAKADATLVNTSLEYLRTHQADAIDAYQEALLRTDRLDAAAQLLIARLHDPDRYRAALIDVQVYTFPPAPPGLAHLRSRWRDVAGRPDVQEAVGQIGRIEKFPIPPQVGF